LEDYINSPGDRGSIRTIYPDKLVEGVPTRSDLGEDALSSTVGPSEVGGTYPNGFVVKFDYSFETSRNSPTGYVQAEGKPEKLSFVGNSGVKFGAYQATGKAVEAAILDVDSMVELGGDLDEFDPSQGGGIDASGNVTIPITPPDPFSLVRPRPQPSPPVARS
jgi:hypothetical protein